MSKQMQIFVPQNLSLNEERAKVSWGLILKNREPTWEWICEQEKDTSKTVWTEWVRELGVCLPNLNFSIFPRFSCHFHLRVIYHVQTALGNGDFQVQKKWQTLSNGVPKIPVSLQTLYFKVLWGYSVIKVCKNMYVHRSYLKALAVGSFPLLFTQASHL